MCDNWEECSHNEKNKDNRVRIIWQLGVPQKKIQIDGYNCSFVIAYSSRRKVQ